MKVEKQSVQIRNLAKTAIHLEEEIQKRSLRSLITKKIDIPEELVKTVEENPEVPKEVKPLEWLVDKKEEVESKTEVITKKVEETPIKTPIQEIVEKHYSKESTIDTPIKVEEIKSDEGVITGSLAYLLNRGDNK